MCLPVLLKTVVLHFTDMYRFQAEYYFYCNPVAVTEYCDFDMIPFQTGTFSLYQFLHLFFIE